MSNLRKRKRTVSFEDPQSDDYSSEEDSRSGSENSNSVASITSYSDNSETEFDYSDSERGSLMTIEADNDLISKNGIKWENGAQAQDANRITPIHYELTQHAENAVSILDILKLFFTEDICKYICEMTNMKIDQYLEHNPGKAIGNKYLHSFSITEIYGFLGLLILTGVFRANKEPINELYSEDPNISRPIFKATIQRERFKTFLRFIRFDDQTTRLERVKDDKLAPIRLVFEHVKSMLFKYYSPGTILTIYERLARIRGKCAFRQYMPAKPGKFGIKIWIAADSKTHNPINIEVT